MGAPVAAVAEPTFDPRLGRVKLPIPNVLEKRLQIELRQVELHVDEAAETVGKTVTDEVPSGRLDRDVLGRL